MSSTPIIDLLTMGRPVLGALAKAGKEAIAARLKKNTDMPPAVADAAAETPNSSSLVAIAENPNVILTSVKPMRRSVEGWLAVAGGVVTLIDKLGPAFGITPDPIVSDAVETVAVAVGLPAGTGKLIVAVGTVGLFAAVWVRRKWFTHAVTPAAADRAVAAGKAV